MFGPVLAVMPFDDEADAIRLANATEYGLVAAVWTRDGGRQLRVARKLRSGQVFVNCYGAGAGIELPFGGTGKSGHGREKGFMALHDFSRRQDGRHQSRLRSATCHDCVERLPSSPAPAAGSARGSPGASPRKARGSRWSTSG